MLLAGSAFMGFFLMLVGGLQGRFGEWGDVDGERTWIITGQGAATRGIIVCSYLFVCSFAITMGPVSWTYPAEIFPMRVRAKAVSLSTAACWLFNFALAWAVPPGLDTIAYKTYFIFGVRFLCSSLVQLHLNCSFCAFVDVQFCLLHSRPVHVSGD